VCLEEGEELVRPMLINPGGCEHVCCEVCLRDLRRMRGPISDLCPVCRSKIASVARLALERPKESAQDSKRMHLEIGGALKAALDTLIDAGCRTIVCVASGGADEQRAELLLRSYPRVRVHVASCVETLAVQWLSLASEAPMVTVCRSAVCDKYAGSVRFDGMLPTCAMWKALHFARALLRPSGFVRIPCVSGTLDEYYCEEICNGIRAGRQPDLAAAYFHCVTRGRSSHIERDNLE
jgi:hypothetical protein